MTVTNQAELEGLQAIGRIVATTLQAMARAMEPGMTTRELDGIGRALLERAGAVPAPEDSYGFPGATCISVNEEIAHGVPGDRVIAAGDLVNIDVSASKDGFFADTGASFAVGAVAPAIERLCRDGRRAMEVGIAQVGADRPLDGIGNAIGRFAAARGYTLIRNLASDVQVSTGPTGTIIEMRKKARTRMFAFSRWARPRAMSSCGTVESRPMVSVFHRLL